MEKNRELAARRAALEARKRALEERRQSRAPKEMQRPQSKRLEPEPLRNTAPRTRSRLAASSLPRELKEIFQLPLSHPGLLSSERVAAFDALRLHALQISGRAEWIKLYEELIEHLSPVKADLEEQIGAIKLLEAGREQDREIEERIFKRPQRRAEQAKRALLDLLKQVQEEFRARLKRQQGYAQEGFFEAILDSVEIDKLPQPKGLHLELSPKRWRALSDYLAQVCDEWLRTLSERIRAACLRRTEKQMRILEEMSGQAFAPPSFEQLPRNTGQLAEQLRPQRDLQLPGQLKALTQYIRSNLMSVGMVAMPLFAVLTLFELKISSTTIRGAMIAALLPIILIFGFFATRQQRREKRQRVEEEFEAEVALKIKRETKAAFVKEQQECERWIKRYIEAWKNALEAYWERVLLPLLEGLEREATERVKENKQDRSKSDSSQKRLEPLQKLFKDKLLVLQTQLRDHRDLLKLEEQDP